MASDRKGPGRALVLAIVFVGLLTMFLGSVFYRLDNPSRTMTLRQPASGEQGGGQQMGMGDIRELMVKMQENPGDTATLLELSRRFMQMQAWDRATVFLENVLTAEPDNLEALSLLGVCRFQLEQYPEAAAAFERVVAARPEVVMPHYYLGVLKKYYLDEPDEARAHFETVMELAPSDDRVREMAAQELDGA